MARKEPTKDVLRALFAKSGNRCAFPGCQHPLVNEKNQFIGQLCHIEAASPGGERYNSHQTDDDRRSYNNLILLCYPHHVETNDVDFYSVEKLLEIKRRHESSFHENIFKIDESLLYKLSAEMEEYWSQIELLNTVRHTFVELAVPINARGTFFDVIRNVRHLLDDVESIKQHFDQSDESLLRDLLKFLNKLGYDTSKVEAVPYYNNPFENRNWEIRNLMFSNVLMKLQIALLQLELKYLEEYLRTNTTDQIARARLNEIKKEFENVAQHAILYD